MAPLGDNLCHFSLTEAHVAFTLLSESKAPRRRPTWMWPSVGFFFFLSLLPFSVNYIRTVICHEPIQLGAAAATESVLCCGFPPACCLVIARPWPGASAPSVQCSRYKWYCEEAARAVHPHMNGRVGEFPLWLARLLRAPVCSQASLVCCVSGGTDWSSGIVIWPLSELGVCLLINVFSGLLHRGRKCHKSSDFRAKAIDPLREH